MQFGWESQNAFVEGVGLTEHIAATLCEDRCLNRYVK